MSNTEINNNNMLNEESVNDESVSNKPSSSVQRIRLIPPTLERKSLVERMMGLQSNESKRNPF
jgi:hypothetical protein